MKFDKAIPEWITLLKSGDIVCDCGFRHLPIIFIKNETRTIRPSWYRYLVFLLWLPDDYIVHDWITKLSLWVDELWELIIGDWCGWHIIVDRTIFFKDNSTCSAMHCCDQATDHNIEDHPKNTKALP